VTDAGIRRQLLDALGYAGQAYRDAPARLRSHGRRGGGRGDRAAAGRRARPPAGVDPCRPPARRLFHAYNLVSFPTRDTAVVEHLPVMLEGQVAVLGTSHLGAEDLTHLVDALFDSPLYRPDLGTFLLYPATDRPSFLDRNRLAPETIEAHPVLQELVAEATAASSSRTPQAGCTSGRTSPTPRHWRTPWRARRWTTTRPRERARRVRAAVPPPRVHRDGRAGCTATRASARSTGTWSPSCCWRSRCATSRRSPTDTDAAVVARLAAAYRRVRDGLGFRKTPAVFGAVPTDCYSHTPAHAGAQQPGMTGQAKEQVLARAGELGLVVADGTLALVRPLLPAEELWGEGEAGEVPSYRFTVCAMPGAGPAGAMPTGSASSATTGAVEERDGHGLDARGVGRGVRPPRDHRQDRVHHTGEVAAASCPRRPRGSGPCTSRCRFTFAINSSQTSTGRARQSWPKAT
jgi:hypothetical protein